jgi:purine-binding chemotaxis protein CheW
VVTSSQYLTFVLDEEIFAVAISKICEVLNFSPITKVPKTPAVIRGVINLRGSVVPVVDLRARFQMPKTNTTIDTCIIILEVVGNDGVTMMGAVADSVQEVQELKLDQSKPPAQTDSTLPHEFIVGMARHDAKPVTILDIERIFSTADLIPVQQDRP